MLATAFHDRAVLAVLGGTAVGLTLITGLSQVEHRCGSVPPAPVAPPASPVSPVSIDDTVGKPIDCRASVANVRHCADDLYRVNKGEEGADLIWSVLRPWRVYGLTVIESTQSTSPSSDAEDLATLASRYRLFASFWRESADPDPRKAYWPLAVARTVDRELGGAHAGEVWARLFDVAPRAARLYASGGTADDCINYVEPAAMAIEVGASVVPPSKRCRRVRR
jgi:hypothetical protein